MLNIHLDVVASGDIVTVWVEGVDKEKGTNFIDDDFAGEKMTYEMEVMAMMDEELQMLIENVSIEVIW